MDWLKMKSGSDVRGRACGEGAVITPAVASALGMAFAQALAAQKGKDVSGITIALGRDSRITGRALLEATADGIVRAGANVMVYYSRNVYAHHYAGVPARRIHHDDGKPPPLGSERPEILYREGRD